MDYCPVCGKKTLSKRILFKKNVKKQVTYFICDKEVGGCGSKFFIRQVKGWIL